MMVNTQPIVADDDGRWWVDGGNDGESLMMDDDNDGESQLIASDDFFPFALRLVFS